MKRILIASLLSTLAFAASAQGQVSVSATADAPTADANGQVANASPFCLHETGSLIVASQNAKAERRARAAARSNETSGYEAPKLRCSEIGRSYTQEDIRRTGALNLADALRQLDPTVY